jgi:hypothetical protein
MSYLDLHGVRHDEVDRQVENFVLLNQQRLPLKIICGNSHKMKEIVKETLNRIDVHYVDSYNGKVTVVKL